MLLKDEGKDREHASEAVDGHERERDAQDGAVLVDFVELWPDRRYKRRGGNKVGR